MLGLIKRVFYLFFLPDRLVKLAQKRTPDAPNEQLKKSIYLVRAHVFRALSITLSAAFLSIGTFWGFSIFNIQLGHKVLALLRFLGYLFVLWGVFSPVGWKIQTYKGETLPEIFDEEWHRLVYGIGLFLFLLSYLFEIYA